MFSVSKEGFQLLDEFKVEQQHAVSRDRHSATILSFPGQY